MKSHTSATFASNASRPPELSTMMSAFARRSSRDACTATRALCVRLDHPSLLDQALDRDVGRHVDHDDRGEPSPAGLDEEGYVEHDDVIGVLLRGEPASGLDADRGMHDRVELFERRRVVEHDRRERGPVEAAVAVADSGAEPLDDRVEHRLAGLLELSGDRVGVDHHGPAGGQERGDGRLSGADAAREAHEDHGRDGTAAVGPDERPFRARRTPPQRDFGMLG